MDIIAEIEAGQGVTIKFGTEVSKEVEVWACNTIAAPDLLTSGHWVFVICTGRRICRCDG